MEELFTLPETNSKSTRNANPENEFPFGDGFLVGANC